MFSALCLRFQRESANAFRNEPLRGTDIVFSSYGKTGTHFVKEMIGALLNVAEDGTHTLEWEEEIDGYPEMFPLELPADPEECKRPFRHKSRKTTQR